MSRYTIKDHQTGRVFCNGNSYRKMAEVYFNIVDQFYGGSYERSSYLHLVDNDSGRAMSVVVKERS